MHPLPWLLMLAIHNRRVNEQMSASCLTLSELELSEDRGAFFKSILGQWNHIMFADLIFLRRLAAKDVGLGLTHDLAAFPVPFRPTDIYFTDIENFRQERRKLDVLMENYLTLLSEPDLSDELRYSSTEGDLVIITKGDLLLHMFMHQIHHRGQISCLLSQSKIDYGVTDLPVIVPEGSRSYATSPIRADTGVRRA